MASIQVNYDTDKHDVTFSSKRYLVRPFRAFGVSSRMVKGDSRNIFKQLTQTESEYFWTMDQLKDHITNEVYFDSSSLGTKKEGRYHKVIKSLIAKNLILRLKQCHYLINPNVTLPTFETYEIVLNKWISLGGIKELPI